MKTLNLAVLLTCLTMVLNAHGLTINARDCGAAADGVQLDTKAIQAALDKCAASGGGTVLLEGGRFLSGTIYLRSHVTLRIEAGATLLGSTNVSDYPHNLPAIHSYTDNYVKQSLIAGENLDDVGELAVDGLDAGFWPGAAPMLSLIQARGAIIRGCQPRAKEGTFLKLSGDATRNVTLIANDLAGAGQPTEIAPNVPAGAWTVK